MCCPLCQNEHMDAFFEISEVPVFCNVLYETAADAQAARRASIKLGYCRQCGMISNTAFDPRLVQYAPTYENSLHNSPRFRQYAQQLATRLAETYHLRDKEVIEIGCGRGEFLATLCEAGSCKGTGYDPSFDTRSMTSPSPRVKILPEPYCAQCKGQKIDFVCCRHVLEHLGEPASLLIQLRWALEFQPQTTLYFEVPNTMCTLKGGGVWDVIYEHPCYFTPASLRASFARAGFQALDIREEYDGQFLSIEARAGDGAPDARPSATDLSNLKALTRSFHLTFQKRKDFWNAKIEQFRRHGQSIALWGSGSKGVTFLNTLKVDTGVMPVAVDLNPRKHGRYIPGTAQPVVAPGYLAKHPVDAILVMNPIYLQEIRQSVKEMRLSAEILVA